MAQDSFESFDCGIAPIEFEEPTLITVEVEAIRQDMSELGRFLFEQGRAINRAYAAALRASDEN